MTALLHLAAIGLAAYGFVLARQRDPRWAVVTTVAMAVLVVAFALA